jgi:hypothetical protein
MNLQLGTQQPPHEPAALARRILSESRFRVLLPAHQARTWWDTLMQWIADRWNQLLDAFSHHLHVGGNWSVATGDVLIAAVIILVIFIIVRLLMSMAKEPDAASGIRTSALRVHADPAELHAAAMAAAQHGAYAVAVALLFQAALAVLDARGVLRDDPARTVNECRSDVRRRAAQLSAPFDRIARIFTAAVYAEVRMNPDQWTQAQEAYTAFTAVHGDAA